MNTIISAKIAQPHTELEEHVHKQWEVIYCSCDGVIHTPKRDYAYERGCVLCVPPMTKHKRSASGERDVAVLIDRALIPDKNVKLYRDDGTLLFACEKALICFDAQDVAMLGAWGNLMVIALTQDNRKNTLSPVVESLKAEIDRNISSSFFSLEDAISARPLHYDYVRKLFKKEIGMTPHDYLIACRMDLARGIMQSGVTNAYSAYSVAQVCEMCGFADPLYFSRVFKKYYGISPTEALKK